MTAMPNTSATPLSATATPPTAATIAGAGPDTPDRQVANPYVAPALTVTAMPTAEAEAYRAGGPDAYGLAPERAVSGGPGHPCRHCLAEIPAGAPMLILAHRPFPAPQPYAETGPIFLCAAPCTRYEGREMPPIARTAPDYLVKGYSAEDRIRYGTGRVVPAGALAGYAADLLARTDVAYVHIRSARNNCFQFRIDAR